MKKRLLIKPLAAAVALLPGVAAAGWMVAQPGPLLTQGTAPTNSTGFAAHYNPAAAEVVIPKEDTIRWGYISSFGVQVEVGEFDNFDTEVEDLIDELDQDDISLSDAEDILDSFDEIRASLAESGDFKLNAHLATPITPLSLRLDSIGGVLSVNSRADVMFGSRFLDDGIVFSDPDGDGNGELLTNTSLYVKGAESIHLGVGYSRELPLKDLPFVAPMFQETSGRLFGGVTLNYYSIALSKQVLALTSQDEDDELGDIVSDSYEENQVTTSNVSLDLGLLWQTDNYGLGFSWRNINEPEFDYGSVGTNCEVDDVNCYTASFFADRIDLNETYVMNSQASVSGSIKTKDSMWELSTAYDLNEALDPLGDEYQWFSIAGNFNFSSWIRARVGYMQNMAGSELSALNAGLSLGVINIDVRYGLDTVEFDGSEIPQMVGFNIGVESMF